MSPTATATSQQCQQGPRRLPDGVTPPSLLLGRAPVRGFFLPRHHTTTIASFLLLVVVLVHAITFADAATPTPTPATPNSTTASSPRPRFKSFFLLFATLDDLGYTFSQNLGRMNAHHRLAARFPDTEIVSVSLPRSFFMNHTELLHGMVRAGCNVIHGTSGGFQGPFRPFVFLYPNVTFTVSSKSLAALSGGAL